MDNNEPKEGEPNQLSTPERRLFKPQTLNWTPPRSPSGSNEDLASAASTPNGNVPTTSTDPPPNSFSFNDGSLHTRLDNDSVDSTAISYGDLSKQHRAGGESYILQEWSDGTPELAPGIPGIIPLKTSPSYGQLPTSSRLITMAYDRGSHADSNHNKTNNGPSNEPTPPISRGGMASLRRSPSTSRISSSAATQSPVTNQTTWVKDALQRSVSEKNVNESNGSVDAKSVDKVSPGAATHTELLDIRMKMEERRRQIEKEKRRLENERSKQRRVVDNKALEAVMTRSSSGLAGTQSSYAEDSTTDPLRRYSRGSISSSGHNSAACGPVVNKKEIFQSHRIGGEPDFSDGNSDSGGSSGGVRNDASNLVEYGTSLDRLNSSLSELQGEIMKLSLNQDPVQVFDRSARGSSISSNSSTSSTSSTNTRTNHTLTSTQAGRDQFFLFPRKSSLPTTESFRTDAPGAASFTAGQAPPSNLYRNIPSMAHPPMGVVTAPPPSQGSLPYPGNYFPFTDQYASSIGHGEYPLHAFGSPMQEPLQVAGRVYLPPTSYVPGTGIYGQYGSQQINHSGSAGSGIIPGQPLSSLNSDLSRHRLEATAFGTSASSNISPNSFGSSVSSPFGSTAADFTHHDPSSTLSAVTSPPPAPIVTPLNQAFYMSIDSTEDVRGIRPTSRSSRDTGVKRDEQLEGHSLGASSSRVRYGQDITSADDGLVSPATLVSPPPAVGFVVGDDVRLQETTDTSELEKRRVQRIQDMQTKRKEEMEAKKHLFDVDQAAKSETDRAKKESVEQKRVDDRARRDAIFNSYLKGKTDDEGPPAEVDPVPKKSVPTGGVARRAAGRTVKPVRPKSQPSLIGDDEEVGESTVARRLDTRHADLFKSTDRLNALQMNGRVGGGGGGATGGTGGAGRGRGGGQGEGDETDQPFTYSSTAASKRPPTPDRAVRQLTGVGGGSDCANIHYVPTDNYAGPKLYVKPNQKSNRTIIVNAIKDCCLAGSVNQETKNKVLEEISKSESKHFVILFRDCGQQYRGLYMYNPDREEVFKIHGVGPKQLTDKMMEKFLKYNSGAKTFTEVTSTKHLSSTIDAVIILNALWQKKPTPGQNKKLY